MGSFIVLIALTAGLPLIAGFNIWATFVFIGIAGGFLSLLGSSIRWIIGPPRKPRLDYV